MRSTRGGHGRQIVISHKTDFALVSRNYVALFEDMTKYYPIGPNLWPKCPFRIPKICSDFFGRFSEYSAKYPDHWKGGSCTQKCIANWKHWYCYCVEIQLQFKFEIANTSPCNHIHLPQNIFASHIQISSKAEKMENLFLYNLQPTSTKSPPCMQASYDSESFKNVKRRFKKIKIFFNYISYV